MYIFFVYMLMWHLRDAMEGFLVNNAHIVSSSKSDCSNYVWSSSYKILLNFFCNAIEQSHMGMEMNGDMIFIVEYSRNNYSRIQKSDQTTDQRVQCLDVYLWTKTNPSK